MSFVRADAGAGEAGAEEEPSVGERLRRLRERHGLSQRELARRAGVTNGTVSLIEQGRSSPSVASLKKILDVLPISISDFFAHPVAARDQVFYAADELALFTHGRIRFRLVAGERPERRLQVMHEHYPPGADTGPEMLRHEGEESGVVVRGRLEAIVGGEMRVLGPGDAYYFESRLPHRFRNVGSEEAVVVSACTPASF